MRISGCIFYFCMGISGLTYGQSPKKGAPIASTPSFSNASFSVSFDPHGLSGIKKVGDVFPTDYIRKGRAFGTFSVTYKKKSSPEWTVYHAGSEANVDMTQPASNTVDYQNTSPDGIVRTTRHFFLKDGELLYQLTLQNMSDQEVKVGSLSLPIPYNQLSGENPKQIFEERVLKHHFISGNGSYVFWQRPTGVAPYLVMLPLKGTSLEYEDVAKTDSMRQVFRVFIHSLAEKANEQGTWRQPQTERSLKPHEAVTYGFTFKWADSYDGIRQVLYESGIPDINIVPGMTIPNDLFARFSIRSKSPLGQLEAEFPAETEIREVAKKGGDLHIYEVRFHHPGENRLTVHYGREEKTYLEFFSTEPLVTLYKKRASFIAHKEQHKVPGKWYDGLFSQWDMKNAVLRGPDNADGFDKSRLAYVLACDDPGLCKAPFLAAKNVYYPDQEEIDAIEYYLEHFVWGGLQRTDQESPYPYGVYGTPNWYVNRDPARRKQISNTNLDKEHVWRSYDYPHIMMLYFHMYQIASLYPDKVHYLDKKEYLIRAKETAKAYFKYPYEILPWYETYKWGCYNELLLVDLMETLKQEGYAEDAEWLRKEWEKKVKYFIYDDPYPYRSEYSIDATAFESSHAFAKYALANTMQPDSNLWFDKNLKKWYSHPKISREEAVRFMEEQMQANIACRGWLENAYYLKGSDFRGKSDSYLLSYMAQMGGWAVVDYALEYSRDPSKYLQLGYASYLSSFALMNTGSADGNYGVWYPGKENDGASGWAFEPARHTTTWIQKEQDRGPWYYDGEIDLGYAGALRTAATILVQDPVFDWFAYGGLMTKEGNQLVISPRDGLQRKFYYMQGDRKLSILLNRDGFLPDKGISLDASLNKLSLILENRTLDAHPETIQLAGLGVGNYRVSLNGKELPKLVVKSMKDVVPLNIATNADKTYQLVVEKMI